jgi:hypothetical protein
VSHPLFADEHNQFYILTLNQIQNQPRVRSGCNGQGIVAGWIEKLHWKVQQASSTLRIAPAIMPIP